MFNCHSLIPWGSFRGRQEEKWGSFRGWDHFGVNLGIISGLGIIPGSGSFRGLYRPRWLTNEQLIRRKCTPTEGELKPKSKNNDGLWKSLWLHASLMLLANKISCIRNSIFLTCWFLFACCTLYNALDLNLDFSKFKLPFKFNKNNKENIYTG